MNIYIPKIITDVSVMQSHYMNQRLRNPPGVRVNHKIHYLNYMKPFTFLQLMKLLSRFGIFEKNHYPDPEKIETFEMNELV